MSLSQAIDDAVDFVKAHSELMTRAELEEFSTLADTVYQLAYREGLVDALPKVTEPAASISMTYLTPCSLPLTGNVLLFKMVNSTGRARMCMRGFPIGLVAAKTEACSANGEMTIPKKPAVASCNPSLQQRWLKF